MANDIPAEFLNNSAALPASSAQAIDQIFAQRQAGNSFITWFNANAASDPVWNGRKILASQACADRFKVFWDGASQVFGSTPNLLQFISLMAIFINEIGGDLQPIEEKVGRPPQHPGIAYAFDAIPGLKRSYNTLSGNMTAFDLFRNDAYRQANANRALADRFPDPANVDRAWSSEAWPTGFPTSTDPAQTGFLLEADFYKFRGRGLIQTTGRVNYIKLIAFIKSYVGNDPVLKQYSQRWTNLSENTVATTSSNEDWHALFFSGTLELAREAIKLHDQGSGGYLDLTISNAQVINAEDGRPGSVFRIGQRISGSNSYAETFKNRVAQVCGLLGGAGV